MEYENNPKSIKYYVKRYLHREKSRFSGKRVVDFPAGNGITSRILKEVGAFPLSFDLFPAYFNIEGLECKKANINEGIPLEDESADAIICQEGIEHFSDQANALKEFNRLLKPGGSLIITTPNYSGMIGKFSFFLSESERFNKLMPPNELDSIWMSKQNVSNEVYYGHIFLIGIQKLRCLAKLAGFKIKQMEFTRAKSTSIVLLILFYPFIFLSNWVAYKKNLSKNHDFDEATKKEVYKEVFKLSVSPKRLVDGHIFVEFEKELDVKEVARNLKSVHKEFGVT